MTDALSRLKAALADRYTIERELGSGGMATVYLAEDLKLHRKVALKVLRPELASALGPERFLQEIDIAAKLNHPHILGLFDCGEADGFLYYVMPYVEGQSLREKLAKEGELPVADAVRILHEVVDALAHAHEHGVVHRDIKPDNVMLSGRHALVTDFGVAKAVSEATGRQKLTTEGIALGTPAYMAPEQAAADPHIDHRADIYAVGAVAYELLTGRPPFTGTSPQMILSAHMTDSPEPVTKYREAVTPVLEQLVLKCLEKKAADRWQSAEELLPQLEALATPSGGTTPVGTVPQSAVVRSKKMAIAASAVAVVLAVIVVVTLFPRSSGITLDPDRVLVAVFENQTGDPTLDPVGVMAGHWITQGLQMSGVVQVVPWLEAQQAARYVASGIDSGTVRNPVIALAEETGAAIVVYGAYYRRGDSVQYHVEVTDATRGQALGSLDPETAPLDTPDDALEPLRQRVMGLLSISFDERISSHASSVMRPPSYDAYRAFEEGMEHYIRREHRDASLRFYQAFELDTSFATPLHYAILCHNNLNEWAQSDSLVGVLEDFRDRLSDYDQHWLDYLKARVDGDNQRALRAIRPAAELAPGSKAVYNRAYLALFTNRPREAIDALLSLDPERGAMRGWTPYYAQLAWGYWGLNEHGKALEAAQKWRTTNRDVVPSLAYEAIALAGLGRVEEVNALVNEIVALPEVGLQQGNWIVAVAAYQRRQGQMDPARITVDRAIQWYEARRPETKSGATWRWRYAAALYHADRLNEAYGVAKALSEEFPENTNYRGLVGVLAACRGDQMEALEISQWLESLDTPYLRGAPEMWRSRVAAALGDGETAVVLFREALARGTAHPRPFHWGLIAFEPLRDHPEFQELMRPKG